MLLFRFADVMARLPGQRLVAPRVAVLNQAVGETAERHGAILVDLFADDEFLNPMLWSPDRLHLSAAGHRRVAAQVLAALGLPPDEQWLVVPPRPAADAVAGGPRRRPALGRPAPGAVDQAPAHRPVLRRHGHREAPDAGAVRRPTVRTLD